MRLRSSSGTLDRTELLALLPAAWLLAVVIWWIANGGGYEAQPALSSDYEPNHWYVGALALLGLTCVTALGVGRVRMTRASKLACLALLGYVLWSFASVLWAGDQGAALLGSDRALVYLAAFVAFAILPWRDLPARVALAGFAAGVGAIAIAAAVQIARSGQPTTLYLGARLSYPLGYYNADAVLFMGGAACSIALASRRGGPAVLRVAGIAVAGLCLQLAVLSQSRGWLFSAPIVLALMLLLIPGRLRLLATAIGPGAATAAIAPALLGVYGEATRSGEVLAQPRLGAVLHTQGVHAVKAMLLADALLALAAVAGVAVDRRVSLAPASLRRINRIAGSVVAAAALAGTVVGLAAVHGDAIGRLESAWNSFAHSPSNSAGGYSHFTTLASNRPDIWRVALHEFALNPIGGIGQDNFATSYARLRHTYEQPRWVHSIELRLLAHTGIVGALLFATFLAAALLAALRGRHGPERVTVGLLLVPLVVWLVQGSVDWFWEYPALSVPALAFTAAAGALSRVQLVQSRTTSRAPGVRGRVLALAAIVAVTLLAAAAWVALIVPFVAARRVQDATRVWPSRPARAYADVRSATALLPFDAQLYLVGGSIALNRGEYGAARAWLNEAERHDAGNWLTPFALGVVEGEQRRLGPARAQMLRAKQLNPVEATISTALSRLAEKRPLTFAEAQGLLAPHITTPAT